MDMDTQPLQPYALIGVVILTVMGMAAVMLVLAHTIGPKRHGAVKDSPYESGMPVIGGTSRRFNVRFYIVAMLFLLFDVELVFMYPWAKVFTQGAARASEAPEAVAAQQFLFVEMGVFFAILLVGYTYAWRKGVFNWD